jgi:hypothetical protein
MIHAYVESMQPVTIDEDSKVIVIPLNNVFSDIDNADGSTLLVPKLIIH